MEKSTASHSSATESSLSTVAPAGGEDKGVISSNFVVQATSTATLRYAEEVAGELGAEGYPAKMRAVDLGSLGKWHRVYVGPYASREEAQLIAQSLRNIPGYEMSFVKALDD